MRNTFKFRFAGICIMLGTCAVFGVAVMLLWNALIPQIFGLMPLDYLQAAGLLILARILFGGLGGGFRDHARGWGAMRGGHHRNNKLREKWMNMSANERKEFIEKEKEFFKHNMRFSHLNDCFGGGENSADADAKKDRQGE
jgi:ABC-type multidrug transport system fused ATPase/permease subunit